LSRLERLAAEIPQVLHDRFRLDLLKPEATRKAIIEPAGLQDPKFGVKPFVFTQRTVDRIVEFLCRSASGVASAGSAIGIAEEEIEPFQLQVICVEAEIAALRKQEAQPNSPTTIDYDNDLRGDDGLQRMLVNFYEQRLQSLPKPNSRRALNRLFERGLIDNRTRRMLDEREI